jgi:hypothetical protein
VPTGSWVPRSWPTILAATFLGGRRLGGLRLRLQGENECSLAYNLGDRAPKFWPFVVPLLAFVLTCWN